MLTMLIWGIFMPFQPIKISGLEPVVGFNVLQEVAYPDDGSPLVVAFDVPKWRWTPWSWSPPRRAISVSASFPTNAGVYGPNPPVLSGLYGVVTGPGLGQYKTMYSMQRVLDPGRYFLVVRSNEAPAAGKVSIEIV